MNNESENSYSPQEEPPHPSPKQEPVEQKSRERTKEQMQSEFLHEVDPELQKIVQNMIETADERSRMLQKIYDSESKLRQRMSSMEKTLEEAREQLGDSPIGQKLFFNEGQGGVQAFFQSRVREPRTSLGLFKGHAKRVLDELLNKESYFKSIDAGKNEISAMQQELDRIEITINEAAELYNSILKTAWERYDNLTELPYQVAEFFKQKIAKSRNAHGQIATSEDQFSKSFEYVIAQVKKRSDEFKLLTQRPAN